MKQIAQLIPSIVLQAGPSPVSHLGPTIGEHYDVAADSIHVMCAEDYPASSTSYWVFEIGRWRAGVWTHLADTSTKPASMGGPGDLLAGIGYPMQHPADALEWGDTLGVKATPIGDPVPACFSFAFPDAPL